MSVSDRNIIVKGVLAAVLGPLAVAGAIVFKSPDDDHFLGKFRDTLRVARTQDQLQILANILRPLSAKYPSSSKHDLTAALIEQRARDIPASMVGIRKEGVVILSPWNTQITAITERGAIGINVPMSQLGCIKTLASLGTSGAYGVSVDGQRLNNPVTSEMASGVCRTGKSVPDVTLWFKA